jgi:hypothetical protein
LPRQPHGRTPKSSWCDHDATSGALADDLRKQVEARGTHGRQDPRPHSLQRHRLRGALFFALTGSAYALDGPLPGQNQVGSDDIINGEVKTADIGTGEVKNGDIGNFEVNANNVAPDSLGGAKIVDRSVKNADLGLGASSSNTIADGGIEGIDVKSDTLTGTQVDELSLDFAVLQRRVADACPPGNAIREVAQNGTVTCESVGGGGGSFWSLSGNAGATSSDFLGTTDNNPLNLRANNARGLRIEPASDGTSQSPNVIGGIADNSVTAGAYAATISGGGRFDPANPATANLVTDDQGTIGGGAANQAGDNAGSTSDRVGATVGGGVFNAASGIGATVGGGDSNTASGLDATVGGGGTNIASAAMPQSPAASPAGARRRQTTTGRSCGRTHRPKTWRRPRATSSLPGLRATSSCNRTRRSTTRAAS